MNDFDVLSNFYDRLMSYNGIDEWIGYVVNTIKRHLKKGQESYYGVDIGCENSIVICLFNYFIKMLNSIIPSIANRIARINIITKSSRYIFCIIRSI